MDYNLYRYGTDGKYQGIEVSHSDEDIDLSLYSPPRYRTFTAPPDYDSETQIPVWEGGAWIVHELSEYDVTLEEAKASKLAELASARWSAETAGLTLDNGTVIRTDSESQSKLAAKAQMATVQVLSGYLSTEAQAALSTVLSALPTATLWKASNADGEDLWASYTASEILSIAVKVATYVQECFDREKALGEIVAACATVEEVEAVTWETDISSESTESA